MAEVASAFVSLLPSAKGWSGKVSDEVGPDLDKAGKSGGARFGKAAMVGLAAGLAGAVAVTKKLYDLGGVFDDVTDTIRVGTGATGEALEGLSDSAKRIATEIPASFEDAGQAVADLNTRLGLTGKPLETLTKQFLEAGRLTGEAIDVQSMTAAFGAFDVKGRATSKVMDDFYRVSQATGVSMNELARGVSTHGAVMRQFGFDASESAALLGTLDKAGLNPTKTIATLSRAMVEFAKDGKDPQKALAGTVGEIEKLTKSGKDAAAVNIAAKVFGTRGASQFVAAVKAGKVNLDDLMGATGATSDTILDASKDTADFAEKWQMFKNRVLLKLEPIATKVFNAFGKGIDKVGPPVEAFLEGMEKGTGAGGKFADILGTVGDVLGTVFGFISNNKAAVGTFAGVILTVVAALKIWAGAQAALNLVMSVNPISLIVIAVAALVAGIVYAYKNSETFRSILKKIWAVLKAVGSFIGKVFVGYLRTMASMWLTVGIFGVKALRTLYAAAFAVFGGILKAAEKGLGWIPGIGDKIKGAREAFANFGDRTVAKLDGVESKLRGVRDAINNIPPSKTFTLNVRTLKSAAAKNEGMLDGVRARGGPVLQGRTYLVGERGPELFTARQSGRIIPNSRIDSGVGTAAASTGGGTLRVVIDAGSVGTLTGWVQDEVGSGAAYARTTGRRTG